MRRTFTRPSHEADVEYIPLYHGFNVDSFEVTIRLRQGGAIILGSVDEALYLTMPDEGISTSLEEAPFWLEEVRHAFLSRDASPLAWRLEGGRNGGVLATTNGHWTISQGGDTVHLELSEMEQLLNTLQLLVGISMAEARPSEVDPDEFSHWSHHRVDMIQACQNPACCAHGHHFQSPRTGNPMHAIGP